MRTAEGISVLMGKSQERGWIWGYRTEGVKQASQIKRPRLKRNWARHGHRSLQDSKKAGKSGQESASHGRATMSQHLWVRKAGVFCCTNLNIQEVFLLKCSVAQVTENTAYSWINSNLGLCEDSVTKKQWCREIANIAIKVAEVMGRGLRADWRGCESLCHSPLT
jgi:hypothetical protein